MLYAHSAEQAYSGELQQLPGWAFSYALACRMMHAGAAPANTAAAVIALTAPRDGTSSPWEGGGSPQLRQAMITFPSMLLAALHACAAGSTATTTLSARWQRTLEGALGVADLLGGSATLAHLQAPTGLGP